MKTSRRIFDSETARALGVRLRAIRGDRTLAEFGELVGVGRSVWSNYEAGRRLPSHETLVRVAQIMDVPLDTILPSVQLRRTVLASGSDYPAEAAALALHLFQRMEPPSAGLERLALWGERWSGILENLFDRCHTEAVLSGRSMTEAAATVQAHFDGRSETEVWEWLGIPSP